MIKNKWKRFAISETLCDWSGIASDDLFDRIMIEDEEGLSHLFAEHDVSVWEPFEDMPYRWVADHIDSLAKSAQEVADYD